MELAWWSYHSAQIGPYTTFKMSQKSEVRSTSTHQWAGWSQSYIHYGYVVLIFVDLADQVIYIPGES